jgi:pimeloyl-ACP methyl ester carboxylesterase
MAAWANTASWSGVIARLQAEGYTVYASPNPSQGLKHGASTIADFLKTIKGPIVLVGHSHGGAVITNAATGNPNVKALVYVDAFARPREGASWDSTCQSRGRLSLRARRRSSTSFSSPAPKRGTRCSTSSPAVYEQAFASNLPAKEAAVLAATQAPATLSAATAPSAKPA